MSRRLTALTLLLRCAVKRRLARVPGPEAAERDFARNARLFLRQPPHLRQVRGGGGLHWISAGPCVPGRALLYFHGGGYVAGSPDSHRGLIARLSRHAATEACAPDYPLAPHAPFPAGFEAALAAWAHLRRLGYRPRAIALAGDSAGGGLALALLARLCAEGTPPACVVAFSPWTDLAMTGDSLRRNRRRDPFLPVERIGELVATVRGDADPRDPRLSPLYAEFPGPPPVMLCHGETEILADDASRMADRLRGFGGRVLQEVHPAAPHAWPVFDGWIPEARATLKRAGRFVQESFSDTSR